LKDAFHKMMQINSRKNDAPPLAGTLQSIAARFTCRLQ
jgi:hypothetical protein